MALIISVSGVRGVIGEDLNAVVAARIGAAFASGDIPRGAEVGIGRDSRPSGPALSFALAGALMNSGLHVVDFGVLPTPTLAFNIRTLGLGGATMITASHNPTEWNGIKSLGPDGMGLPPDAAAALAERYHDGSHTFVDAMQCGRFRTDDRAVIRHVDAVMDTVDAGSLAGIRNAVMTVVLDSTNGAGGAAGTQILERLGCRVVPMNTDPSGQFAHPPEPLKEHLGDLCEAVRREGAQVGFAQDPDADRLVVVDENGRYIGEEYTLALSAMYVLSRRPGPVAANLSTSRMIDDLAEYAGVPVHRTPVGEANVAAALSANDGVIGGEGNGGVIDPRVVPVRDSIGGMALILQLLADSGLSLSTLVDQLPRYAMIKTKFSCPADRVPAVVQQARESFGQYDINTSDGVRIDFRDEKAWVHVRGSNTEPIMRIIAEAPDSTQAQGLIDRVQDAIAPALA